MQFLIGAEHDVCHIDPVDPNAYEWWYFDAISGDGRFALVAIFFLGTPMSPYYKQVVDGREPIPRDWCGVFFSLHAKVGERWRERAWAYNVYRDGRFSMTSPTAQIASSSMSGEVVGDRWHWSLNIDESALWRGRVRARLRFSLQGKPPSLAGTLRSQPASDHTWACIAPRCSVEGSVEMTGKQVAFEGIGYHDHNFGRLPWVGTRLWYWARVHLPDDNPFSTAILYQTVHEDGAESGALLFCHNDGSVVPSVPTQVLPQLLSVRNAFGLRHAEHWNGPGIHASFDGRSGVFSDGPFYRRMPVTWRVDQVSAVGIGEIFEPTRLCGPIASRAIWTRMRRRS